MIIIIIIKYFIIIIIVVINIVIIIIIIIIFIIFIYLFFSYVLADGLLGNIFGYYTKKVRIEKIIIENFACPNRRFLGNYLSKRQVGRVDLLGVITKYFPNKPSSKA